MKKPANLYIFIVLVFALALRLIYFFGILEGDDAEYVDRAYYISQHGLAGLKDLDDLPGSNRPGQYLPTALIFRLFGVSELSTALFPLLASLITCYLIYRIGRLLISEEAGLLSAFLWAIFPLNIFLATQLDPEGPLTMATTGAMYSLMLSNTRDKPVSKIGLYFLSLVLIGWAYLIKQSALPIVFAAAAWFYWSYARTAEMRLQLTARFSKKTLSYVLGTSLALVLVFLIVYLLKQPWDKSINSAELTATDISQTLILGRMNPVRWQELGNQYYFSLNREIYTPVPAQNTLATYPAAIQFTLFDAFAPVLFLALAVLSIAKERKAYFVMLWLAVLFLYIEWGPYPRNLRQIFYYLPVSHWISPDNLLYICIPLLLVIGAFLSKQLSESGARKTIAISVPVVLLTVALLENQQTGAWASSFIAACTVTVFFFSLIGPGLLSTLQLNKAAQHTAYMGLVALIGIGSLQHGLHYHISFFDNFVARRENLKAINAYLENEPQLPILYGTNGLSNWLNAYSGYLYAGPGFTQPTYPETRMTQEKEDINIAGGFLLEEGCGVPAPSFSSWSLREFGDRSLATCISLVRSLPANEADAYFSRAAEAVNNVPTRDNLLAYIDAAAKTENLSAFIAGLSQMATLYPENTPIIQASGILASEAVLSQAGNTTLDLLASNANWLLGPQLVKETATALGEALFEVRIDDSTQDIQAIQAPVLLKGNTAYVLDIEFTTFAPANLVEIRQPFIPDSSPDGWERQPDWTNYKIAFVTPEFPEGTQEVLIDIANIYDRGSIRFRKIDLIEISHGH